MAEDLARCHACRGLLSKVDVEIAESGSQQLQAFADSVVRGSETGFGGLIMPAEEWFELTRGLHRLLRALLIRRSGPAMAFLGLLDVDVDALPEVSIGLPLECLPVHDRVAYLSAVNSILRAGAVRFSAAAQETHLAHSYCKAAIGQGLSCMAQLLPETTPRPYEAGVTDPDRPHSRQSVLRDWLLFKRKALRAGVDRTN